jgi:hypothetical protein
VANVTELRAGGADQGERDRSVVDLPEQLAHPLLAQGRQRPSTRGPPDDQVALAELGERLADIRGWKAERLQEPAHADRSEPAALGSVPGHLPEDEDAVGHPGELLDLEPEAPLCHPSAPASFSTSSRAASQPGRVTLTSRFCPDPLTVNSSPIVLICAAKFEESSLL